MKEILLIVLGAIAAKATELLVEAVRQRRHGRQSLEFVGLEATTTWGWSGADLLRRLIKLDHRLLGDDLTSEREGTVEQWAPVFLANPSSWTLLVSRPRDIVGYWMFVALSPVEFERARAGSLLDSEISVAKVQPLDVPGVYNLYFVLLGVLPGFPGGGARLIDAFFTRLEEMASRGVFFREVIANAYTAEGKRICEGFGMERVGPHQDFGTVYSLKLTPWPRALRFKRWSDLADSYRRALEEGPE